MLSKKVLATAGLAVLLAVGGAVAAHESAQAARKGVAVAHVKKQLRAGVLRAGVKYIGLTRAQLKVELPGHSLAQLAVAHGKTVDGLEAAMLAAAKARLDKAVAAGRLAPARAATIAANLSTRIDRLANHVFAKAGAVLNAKHVGLARGFLLRAGVKYIGLTRAQLKAQLPGHSLAQVAVANGKTVDGLEAAILAAAKAKLDKAVAAGRRTSAQEAAALAKLPARIAALVNHVFPSA